MHNLRDKTSKISFLFNSVFSLHTHIVSIVDRTDNFQVILEFPLWFATYVLSFFFFFGNLSYLIGSNGASNCCINIWHNQEFWENLWNSLLTFSLVVFSLFQSVLENSLWKHITIYVKTVSTQFTLTLIH
jgi:hypothetical protein